MTQDSRVQAFVAAFEGLRAEVEKVIVGHREVITHVLTGMFAGGHVLLEGVPGLGKTLLIKTLSGGARPVLLAHSVHARPDAGRHHRHQHHRRGRGRPEALPVPARADLRAHPARRRDQPRHAQDAVRAARGDAGERGHRRRRHAAARRRRSSCSRRRTRSRWKGTYPLPEAQLDRFLFKLRVRYPAARGAERDHRSHDAVAYRHGRTAS